MVSYMNELSGQESGRMCWKLRLGGRLSGRQVADLASELHHDEQGISDVYEMMFDGTDDRVSYNASWVLSHLSPEDKGLYLFPLADRLIDQVIVSVQHHNLRSYLAILADMPCIPENRMDLLDFCLSHIADTKVSHASRSYMIKLAARMCRPYPELMHELVLCLEMLPPDLPPSLASARRHVVRNVCGTLRKK